MGNKVSKTIEPTIVKKRFFFHVGINYISWIGLSQDNILYYIVKSRDHFFYRKILFFEEISDNEVILGVVNPIQNMIIIRVTRLKDGKILIQNSQLDTYPLLILPKDIPPEAHEPIQIDWIDILMNRIFV